MADLETIIELRRGDSRTLPISDLRDSNGLAAIFVDSDVLTFTLRAPDRSWTITKTSADGGVTFVAGSGVGSVILTPADWAGVLCQRRYRCRADLQIVRQASPANLTETLWEADVIVKPDVTP
jgi:hypothetical protein